jgi:hypothetical protein
MTTNELAKEWMEHWLDYQSDSVKIHDSLTELLEHIYEQGYNKALKDLWNEHKDND